MRRIKHQSPRGEGSHSSSCLRVALGVLFALAVLIGCAPQESALPETSLALHEPGGQALALRVVDEPAPSTAAALYESFGRAQAAAAFWAAEAAATDSPDLWRQVARQLTAQGDWSAAQQAWESLLALLPQDDEAHFELGLLLMPYAPQAADAHLASISPDTDFAAQAEVLRDVLLAVVEVPAAQRSVQIGQALVNLGRWGQAEQVFSAAVAWEPSYAAAWAYLGLARAQQGKPVQQTFERALALAPGDPLVVFLYGLMLRAVGEDAQSIEALLEAQRMLPENPAVAAELGMAYRLSGDFALAAYWMQQANLLAPADDAFLRLLALFYAEELFNIDGDGLTVLQEAAARFPQDADIQAAYAWVLFNAGQEAASEAAFASVFDLDPHNPRGLYYQGLVYRQRARTQAAIDTLSLLLEHSDPQGYDVLARRALAQLGQ